MARTGRAFPSRILMQNTRMAARARLTITTLISFGGVWPVQRSLDPADYGTTVTAYLELHAKTSSAAAPFQGFLKNVTLASTVGGSGVVTAATTETRVRSSAFTLASGINTYEVDFGGTSGVTYTLFDAVLVLVAS